LTNILLTKDGEKVIEAIFPNIIRVWDWKNNKIIQEKKLDFGHIAKSMLCANDNILITFLLDGRIKIFQMPEISLCNEFKPENNNFRLNTIHPTEKILASGKRNSQYIYFYDYNTFKKINKKKINTEKHSACYISFNNKENYLIIGNTLDLFLLSYPELNVLKKIHDLKESISHFSFSPDGKLVAFSTLNFIILFDFDKLLNNSNKLLEIKLKDIEKRN